MSKRRVTTISLCFGGAVVVLHIVLIVLLVRNFSRDADDPLDDDGAGRMAKMKETEDPKFQIDARGEGWTRLASGFTIKARHSTLPTPPPASSTTISIEEAEYDPEDDDPKNDDNNQLEENGDWTTIELTTPVYTVPPRDQISSTKPSTKPSTSSTTSTTTTPSTSSTSSTVPPTTAIHVLPQSPQHHQRRYEENLTQRPIKVTNDLLRKAHDKHVPVEHHLRHHHHHRLHITQDKPNTTVVTALLDIGRGHWHNFRRPLAKYHQFMAQLLRLRIPMVVFTDNSSYNFIVKTRDELGLLGITLVHKIALQDLPLYQHFDVFRAIIYHEQHGNGWHPDWDPAMKTHPEAKSAEYDLLVNSKPYFVHNVSVENPFDTEFFSWIDAGYGQGGGERFPADFRWGPAFPKGQISIAKVTPDFDDIRRYGIKELYRKDIAVISGGFFAGDAFAVDQLLHRFNTKLLELIFRYRIVDDDQTTFVLLINDSPSLFNVLHADWFDAFRLFRR